MATIIMGLDPGRTVGFGILEVDDNTRLMAPRDYGTVASLKPGQYLLELFCWLERALDGIDLVAVEEPAYKGHIDVLTAKTMGVIDLVCLQRGINRVGYGPTSWKASLGYGHMTKSACKKTVCDLLGIQRIKSQDAADGLGVAICRAVRELGGRFPVEADTVPEKRKAKPRMIDPSTLSDEEIRKAAKDKRLVGRARGSTFKVEGVVPEKSEEENK